MNVSRGDVVLVEFPFTSGTAKKLRPAVVVQNDQNNRRLATTILAPVTSNTRLSQEPTQVGVDPAEAVGRPTGLLKPSAIKCENLATIEVHLIRRRIGAVPAPPMTLVDESLKASLGIG